MSHERLHEYLDQMLESARLARTYVEGMDREVFLADRRTQQAVVLNLMVIGEAVNRLHNENAEFLARNADVPWRSMRGMRNRIAHGYFDIDVAIVWDTVHQDLPGLIERVTAIRTGLDGAA